MYPILDISSKYVGVLGLKWRQINLEASHYDAFIFDAVTGQHLWTFTQPVPPDDVNYRFGSIAIDGDLAAIGAIYARVPLPTGGNAYNAGEVFVYDLTTGQLRHRIVSDSPQSGSNFGGDVDILGNRIVAGSAYGAYLFDATTGAQLAKFEPTPGFGASAAIGETAIVVGSPSDSSRGRFSGAVFTYDPQTYAQIAKFIPSDAAAFDAFGQLPAVDGRYAIASGRRGTYVFDVITGAEQQKLELPNDTTGALPHVIDIQGKTALIGRPAAGLVMTFDWTTGMPLQALVPSDFSSQLQFGRVAMSGNKAIVGVGGKVYEFHLIPEPSGATLLFIGVAATLLAQRRPVKRKRR